MKIRRVLPVICRLLICPGIGVAGNTLSAEDGNGFGWQVTRLERSRWRAGWMRPRSDA